jgi:hypothetical protein
MKDMVDSTKSADGCKTYLDGNRHFDRITGNVTQVTLIHFSECSLAQGPICDGHVRQMALVIAFIRRPFGGRARFYRLVMDT